MSAAAGITDSESLEFFFDPLSSSEGSTSIPSSGLGFLIAKVLRAVLPQGVFCWISRATIQIQATFFPTARPYWSKITDDLYLGAIPLKNWGHIDTLISTVGVKAILAIAQPHEFESQAFASPVESKEWKAKGVEFLNLDTPDLEPVPIVQLAQAVNYIKQQILDRGIVYLHCTGGRGRSASAAICFLIDQAKGKLSVKEAIRRVKELRPQTILSYDQILSIVNWSKRYFSIKDDYSMALA